MKTKYIVSIGLVLIFALILYAIYKTGRFKRAQHIIAAVSGAIVLMYILYTCTSDD